MRRSLLWGLAMAFLCAGLGCGTSAERDHEALYKDEWQAIAEVVEALESVHDKNSARAAAARINVACDRLEELAREAQKAPPMSPQEHQKMVDKHSAKEAELGARYIQAKGAALRNSDAEPEFGRALMRYENKSWRSKGASGRP